jgi:hypothetical protein
VVKAKKVEDIEEAEAMEDSQEDSKARESWNSASSSTKQPEMKFFPHGIGRDRQAVSYDTVKDHIVQYIQKTYRNGQDAAVSIRKLVVMDLTPHEPKRGISRDIDATANLKAQAGKDILYQAKLKRYLERKDTLEQNLTKAYALIFSTYCNKTTLHSGVMVMGGLISGFRKSHLWIGLSLIYHHRNPLMPISSSGFYLSFFLNIVNP